MKVKLSNGSIKYFPNGTSKEEIKASLRKEFPAKDSQPYKPIGLLGGLIPKFGHAAKVIGGDVLNAAGSAVNAVDPLAKQIMQEPGSAAKNVGSSAAQIGADIVESPRNLPQFLSHLGFIKPETAEKASNFMPTFTPDLGNIGKAANKLLGTNREEDIKIQEGLKGAAALSPFGRSVLKGTMAAGGKVASIPGKIAEKFKGGEVPGGSQLSEIEQQLAEHNKTHSAIEDAENEAKRISTIETGKSNPASMRHEKSNIEKEQGRLPPQTEMSAIEKPYHLEKDLINSEDKLDNLNSVIDEKLGRGQQHDVRAANNIHADLDKLRQEGSQGFKDLEKSYEDKNVVVVKEKGIEQAMKELSSSVSPQWLQSPEGQALVSQIAKMEEHEVIPAKNMLAAIRTARDLAKKMRDKQFAYGTNAEERLLLDEKARTMEEQVKNVSELFEDSIGEKDAARLKELNKFWREKVIPLQRNKVYQKMRYEGKFDWDLIHELRGKVKGDDLIKAAIKENPETLKMILGKRYYEQPEKLFEPNETAREYLEHAPDVKGLLEAHKNLSSGINRLKELKPGVYKKANAMTNAMFKNEDYNTRKVILDKHIKALEEMAKKKDISLKERVKLQNELKLAKKIERQNTPAVSEGFMGVTAADVVPPQYKIPYKIGKHLWMKARGKK